VELQIRHLCKTYANGVRALDNISLIIRSGLFGLLGPNGAGKSTLMRTIATLQEADSGEVWMGTLNVLEKKDEVRRCLGYLPQDFGVYPRTSPEEMLDYIALLKGIVDAKQRRSVVDALLRKVNLYDERKRALTSFSGGMRQRFGIAQALIGNPRLLIVDEPTAGLDPGERNRFYNLLTEVGEEVIVILSTHIVQDVRELCSDMAIINKGRLMGTGAPDQLLSELQGKVWRRTTTREELPAIEAAFRVLSTKMVAGRPLVHVFAEEHPGDGFEVSNADLEDVFFARIKGHVRH
jgi:ABC-2 type transport system ATP-binding protein